ncbi:MAG: hypothetical protein M0Q91_05295 [Methanoregula sp.]|nr:hypothetical protein [Methanoregula sp.]
MKCVLFKEFNESRKAIKNVRAIPSNIHAAMSADGISNTAFFQDLLIALPQLLGEIAIPRKFFPAIVFFLRYLETHSPLLWHEE